MQRLELPSENITGKKNDQIWESSEPECRLEAVAGVDEIGRWGSRAACEGGGGNSLVRKVCNGALYELFCCKRALIKDLKYYPFLLENAHASIDLHSVQKAKHILKKLL